MILKRKFLFFTFLLLGMFFGVGKIQAATVTTAGNGNWNSTINNAPWPGGTVPQSTDDVVIAPGHTITVTADATINSITFAATATTSKTLSVDSEKILMVTASITNNSAAGNNSTSVITGAGTINCGSLANGTSVTPTGNRTQTLNLTIAALNISGNMSANSYFSSPRTSNATIGLQSGSVTVGGTVNMNPVTSSTATVAMNTGAQTGHLKLAGATPWIYGVGTVTTSLSGAGSTVEYTGVGQTVRATAYRHLTLSGSGTYVMAGTVNVAGNLLMNGTVTTTAAGNFGTMGGTLTINSGNSLTIGNSYSLQVTGAAIIDGSLTYGSTSSHSYNSLTINGTLTTSTTAVGALGVTDLTINNGSTFNNAINKSVSVSGNFAVNGGTNTWGTGVYTLNGAAKAISCGIAVSIPNLTVGGTIQNDCNNLSVTTALAGSGTLTNGATGYLKIGFVGAMGLTNLDASVSGNTVEYNRDGTQTIKVPVSSTYHNLVLSGTGTATKSAGGALTVNGDFTIGGNASFAGGLSWMHTFLGSWIVDTTIGSSPYTYTTAGTINFNTAGSPTAEIIGGTSSQTINFYNLNINNTAGVTCNKNIAIDNASGTLTIGSGANFAPTATTIISGNGTLTGAGTAQVSRTSATADFSSQYTISNKTYTNLTIEYVGGSAQTVSEVDYGNLKISTTGGAVATLANNTTITGNLTISNGGTLNAGSNYNLNVAGNWSNSGTFTAQGGVVTFNGSATQTVSGSTTTSFNDLVVTNSSGASASDNERTSFVPSVDFDVPTTSIGTFTINMPNVRVEFNSGSTYTFNNINWNGQSSGSKIFFRNSATNGTWRLKVTGTQTVSNVNVSRSNASVSGGSAISASDGTNSDANNNTNWIFTAGSLAVDMVDSDGTPIGSPFIAFPSKTFGWDIQQSVATLGDSNQKVRISNTTATASWTLSIAATNGNASLWQGSSYSYDFNGSSSAGRLKMDPSSSIITPQDGCGITGLSKGTATYFSQGSQDSINLITAGGTAQTNCYWDITGISMTQDIPASQQADSYSIGMTLTAI